MTLIDCFYEVLLLGAQSKAILIFLPLGFLFLNRDIFGHTIFLVLFSVALNAYLKSIWQIPLNPELGKEGWAFPSGHTQVNVTLWLYLCLVIGKKRLYVFSTLFITGIICGMEHFRYHDWVDIMAGLAFAGIVTIIYYYLVKLTRFKPYIWGLILASVQLFILFVLLPKSVMHYYWIWKGLGAMGGIITGWMLLDKFEIKAHIKHKFICLILFGLLNVSVHYTVQLIDYPILDSFIELFIVGFGISFILPVIDKVLRRKFFQTALKQEAL